MGTYVPRRVAKLSRAISRLQGRNAPRRQGKRRARVPAVEKETGKRAKEEEQNERRAARRGCAEAKRKVVGRTRNGEKEERAARGGG